jgi:hypothetical protein
MTASGDWWDTFELESYADVASGMSGAPMFAWFDDGNPCAIGVLRGYEAVDYGFGKTPTRSLGRTTPCCDGQLCARPLGLAQIFTAIISGEWIR